MEQQHPGARRDAEVGEQFGPARDEVHLQTLVHGQPHLGRGAPQPHVMAERFEVEVDVHIVTSYYEYTQSGANAAVISH